MKSKLFSACIVIFVISVYAVAMFIIAAFISKGRQATEPTKEVEQKIVPICYRKEMNDFLSVQSDIIVIDNKPFVCTKTKYGVFCQEIPECP